MQRKVLCNNCKFYKDEIEFKYPSGKNTGTDIHTVCNCPYNIDNDFDPKDPHKYISTPSVINRNCDCSWFEVGVKENTYKWGYSNVKPLYQDHGNGTFNINPKDGFDGFFVGDVSFGDVLNMLLVRIEELERRVDKLDPESESESETESESTTIYKNPS